MKKKPYKVRTEKVVANIQELIDCLENKDKFEENKWIYRAQPSGMDLETSLERTCNSSHLSLYEDIEDIEENMIRQFRRVYDGNDRKKVEDDTLYCISLMQHHGAPTRLLDFTYSKYLAMYFALECAFNYISRNVKQELGKSTIWCIKKDLLLDNFKIAFKNTEVAKLYLDRGKKDKKRNDKTFIPLYMKNKHLLVLWENPIQLHTRLHLQQGVFLCPGNVRKTFMKNLLNTYEKGKIDRDTIDKMIRKIELSFKPDQLRTAFEQFMRMNLSRESLFPGLDGFAESMKYQFSFYKMMADERRLDNLNIL